MHLGFIDTEMTAYSEAPKMPPAEAARLALDGVEAGEIEILDETSKLVRAGLSDPLEDQFAHFVPTSLHPNDRD